jgi:DNA-binding NarL/FixJ family response regulator
MNHPSQTRLVLVDDHELVREGLKAMLGSTPQFEIVGEAGNASDALDVVARTQPHLVLMDVGMKDINGIELTSRLLALHRGLLILMLSMYDNPATVSRAMEAGARGYVLKDAPSDDIVRAIQCLMSGGTFLSSDVAGRLLRSQTPKPLLSPREAAILSQLAKGHSSKQMALELGVSARTVETHRQNIRRKLNLEGQAELIKYAVEHCREFELN